MMTGTIAVSELGGPMRPSPFGPSQPSAPTIHVSEKMSPASVSSMSETVRVKTSSSTAISTSARPISGAIPSSVAFLYSSSTTTGDRLLTRSGPSSAAASSFDPPFGVLYPLVSRIDQPDVGDRDRRAVRVDAGHRVQGALELGRVADRVYLRLGDQPEVVGLQRGADQDRGRDERVGRREQLAHAPIADDGACQGGHLGEAGGRQRLPAEEEGVTMLTSPDSLKRSPISPVALATGCPGGRKATSAPSVGGARSVDP